MASSARPGHVGCGSCRHAKRCRRAERDLEYRQMTAELASNSASGTPTAERRNADITAWIAVAAGALGAMLATLDISIVNSRSAEHTSELPSLMRRSYAVFCLKQKTHLPCHEKPHP